MKKVLTLAALMLTVGASAVLAQGLNLNFNDCAAGGGAPSVVVNCNSNLAAGTLTLVCSVFPQAPMSHFAAATAVVDISVQAGTLPAWWQTASGQCRANAISMSFDPAGNLTSCADIWGGNPNLQVTAIQQGLHGASSVRVNGVAALPAGGEIALATGSELFLCYVKIGKASTTTCAGCTTPASIVLNESSIQSPDEPKQTITNVADNYCVGISGGTANCPGATPAQNRTWGSVKNLYR